MAGALIYIYICCFIVNQYPLGSNISWGIFSICAECTWLLPPPPLSTMSACPCHAYGLTYSHTRSIRSFFGPPAERPAALAALDFTSFHLSTYPEKGRKAIFFWPIDRFPDEYDHKRRFSLWPSVYVVGVGDGDRNPCPLSYVRFMLEGRRADPERFACHACLGIHLLGMLVESETCPSLNTWNLTILEICGFVDFPLRYHDFWRYPPDLFINNLVIKFNSRSTRQNT